MKNLKAIILFFIFQLSVLCGWGQNLILNGGFEDTVDNCYDLYTNGNFSNKLFAKNWFTPTNCTPDIVGTSFSYCPYSYGFLSTNHSANSGLNCGGVITFGSAANNWREYLCGKLNKPLENGKTYCLSFFLKSELINSCFTNKFGVVFQNDSLYSPNLCTKLNLTPNFTFNQIIQNNDWVEYSLQITAVGGENFIYFGNFSNDDDLLIISNGNTPCISYLFIDDVSLTLCNDPTESTWNLYPNPSNDGAIQLNGHLLTEGDLIIHNEIGQLVYSEKIVPGDFNKNYPLQLATGVYCVTIKEEFSVETKKIVVLRN